MNFRQIKETCIYHSDLLAAREFYEGKLGLEVIGYVTGKHIFFRAGASVLLCFNPDDSKAKTSPPGHYSAGRYHFAFEVEAPDYERSKAEIVGKGIQILDQVMWPSGVESFYFEDGLGNVVEVVQPNMWK